MGEHNAPKKSKVLIRGYGNPIYLKYVFHRNEDYFCESFDKVYSVV